MVQVDGISSNLRSVLHNFAAFNSGKSIEHSKDKFKFVNSLQENNKL